MVNDIEQALGPISVTSYGDSVRIHPAGCYDDKTVLLVESIDESSNAKISLMPGEQLQSETLWEAKRNHKDARKSGRRRAKVL